MDLKELNESLKTSSCDPDHASKLKIALQDIAEILKTAAVLVPNVIAKEALIAMSGILLVIASQIC